LIVNQPSAGARSSTGIDQPATDTRVPSIVTLSTYQGSARSLGTVHAARTASADAMSSPRTGGDARGESRQR